MPLSVGSLLYQVPSLARRAGAEVVYAPAPAPRRGAVPAHARTLLPVRAYVLLSPPAVTVSSHASRRGLRCTCDQRTIGSPRQSIPHKGMAGELRSQRENAPVAHPVHSPARQYVRSPRSGSIHVRRNLNAGVMNAAPTGYALIVTPPVHAELLVSVPSSLHGARDRPFWTICLLQMPYLAQAVPVIEPALDPWLLMLN